MGDHDPLGAPTGAAGKGHAIGIGFANRDLRGRIGFSGYVIGENGKIGCGGPIADGDDSFQAGQAVADSGDGRGRFGFGKNLSDPVFLQQVR